MPKLEEDEIRGIINLETARQNARKADEDREETSFRHSMQPAQPSTYDVPSAMAAATAEITEQVIRAAQVYTTRLLSLPVFEKILSDFMKQLEGTFSHVPTLSAYSTTFMSSMPKSALSGTKRMKGNEAQEMLQYVGQFIDQLQACIVDGCGTYMLDMVERSHRRLSRRLCPLKQPIEIDENEGRVLTSRLAINDPHSESEKEPSMLGSNTNENIIDDMFAPGDFDAAPGSTSPTTSNAVDQRMVAEAGLNNGESDAEENPFDQVDNSEESLSVTDGIPTSAVPETSSFSHDVADLKYHASSRFLLGDDGDDDAFGIVRRKKQPFSEPAPTLTPKETIKTSVVAAPVSTTAAGPNTPQSTEIKEPWYIVPLTGSASRHEVVSNGVRRAIEAEIYVPLSQRLHEVLSTPEASVCVEEAKKLDVIISGGIASKPQAFFGIDVRPGHGHESPSNWHDIVVLLRMLARGNDGAGFDTGTSFESFDSRSPSARGSASSLKGHGISGGGVVSLVTGVLSGTDDLIGGGSRTKEIQKAAIISHRKREQQRLQNSTPRSSSVMIRHTTLPCDKAAILMRAAKEIPRLFQREQMQVSQGRAKISQDAPVLGADDVLPIFIYCLAHSGISGQQLAELRFIVANLSDPNRRHAELGYYIVMFEAAVEHLKGMDLTDLLHSGPQNIMRRQPRDSDGTSSSVGRDFSRGVEGYLSNTKSISNAAAAPTSVITSQNRGITYSWSGSSSSSSTYGSNLRDFVAPYSQQAAEDFPSMVY